MSEHAAGATATLSCPACQEPRPLLEVLQRLPCRCGRQSFLKYEFDTERFELELNSVNVGTTVRDLGRRIEVLASNLDAIDPLSRWPGEPRFNWKPGVAIATFGAMLALIGSAVSGRLEDFGSVVLVVGAGLGVYLWSRYRQLRRAHRRDTRTSYGNAELAAYLRSQVEFYDEVLNYSLSQR